MMMNKHMGQDVPGRGAVPRAEAAVQGGVLLPEARAVTEAVTAVRLPALHRGEVRDGGGLPEGPEAHLPEEGAATMGVRGIRPTGKRGRITGRLRLAGFF